MKKRIDTGYSRRLRQLSAIIICAIVVAGLTTHVATVSAATVPKILILGQESNSQQQNDTLILKVNETFTMNVNITDYTDLYDYQIVFKYNQTMLNMTDLTFPANNVFGSHSPVSTMLTPFNQTPSSLIDLRDQFGVAEAGQSLLTTAGMDVSNALLFQVNFTVATAGETTVHISTINNTAMLPPIGSQAWYTFTQNSDQALLGVENDNFDLTNATLIVIAGLSVPPPFGSFVCHGTPVSSKNHLLLMYTAGEGVTTTNVFAYLPTYFNASDSYDKYGTITEYIWNFGDGNTTVVNATGSPTDALITHVYTGVGIFDVNLTLVARSGPNATQVSTPFIYPITVDLALNLFDWTPILYTFLGIIVAAIVISSVRSAVRRNRVRRLRQQKMRRPDFSGQPQTGTGTTQSR